MTNPSPDRRYEYSIINKPALRFMELKPDALDIQSIMDKACDCILNDGHATEVEISKIFKGSEGHRYFYLYFKIKDHKEKESIFDAINMDFQQLMKENLYISYNGNTLKKILKEEKEDKTLPSQTSTIRFNTITKTPKVRRKKRVKESIIAYSKQSNTNKSESNLINTGKPIRIDINMNDISDFLSYLKKREPNRHNRQRYIEILKSLYDNGWNDYHHSTFIDDNKYKVSHKDIEVFVNGIKSDDFRVSVKEYSKTLELYLTYKWEKKYMRPKNIANNAPTPPIVKVRMGDEEVTDSERSDEEKKIFATINHLQNWTSQNTKKAFNGETNNPSTKYIGGVQGTRKTQILQSASIAEDETHLNIIFNLDQPKEDDQGNNIQEADTPVIPSKENINDKEETIIESSENTNVDTSPVSDSELTKQAIGNNISNILLLLAKGIYKYIKVVSKDMLHSLFACLKRI